MSGFYTLRLDKRPHWDDSLGMSRRHRGLYRLDATSRRLLVALSTDGRRSAAALAKQLGLSRQAVAERIRDLERRGVIRGYRADVDPAALGLEVQAHIRLSLDGSRG